MPSQGIEAQLDRDVQLRQTFIDREAAHMQSEHTTHDFRQDYRILKSAIDVELYSCRREEESLKLAWAKMCQNAEPEAPVQEDRPPIEENAGVKEARAKLEDHLAKSRVIRGLVREEQRQLHLTLSKIDPDTRQRNCNRMKEIKSLADGAMRDYAQALKRGETYDESIKARIQAIIDRAGDPTAMTQKETLDLLELEETLEARAEAYDFMCAYKSKVLLDNQVRWILMMDKVAQSMSSVKGHRSS